MKYVKQFGIILAVAFAGEILNTLIPLPIPASIYGLVIMLILLCTGIIRPAAVNSAAKLLIDIMPLMFIPAGVGLLKAWDVLRPIFLPVAVITLVSTVAVMAVSGRITQAVINRAEKKGGEKNE